MSARVQPDELVHALTGSAGPPPGAGGSDEAPEAAAGGRLRGPTPACVVSQDLYYREATSLSVWSVLTWTLGAATVVFAILVVVLIASAILQSDDAVDRAVKVGASVLAFGATLVGSKTWKFVFDQLKDQRGVVDEALKTVATNCGKPAADAAKAAVATSRHKPLPG
jgi:hypothetical protein